MAYDIAVQDVRAQENFVGVDGKTTYAYYFLYQTELRSFHIVYPQIEGDSGFNMYFRAFATEKEAQIWIGEHRDLDKQYMFSIAKRRVCYPLWHPMGSQSAFHIPAFPPL